MNLRVTFLLLWLIAASRMRADNLYDGLLKGLFSQHQQYVALGWLKLAPPMIGASDYYDQQLRALQGAELFGLARARVRALHPELVDSKVEIHAVRTDGSMLARVAAVGEDQKYTLTFLNALLDEYLGKQEKTIKAGKEENLLRLLDEALSAERDCEKVVDKMTTYSDAEFQRALDVVKERYEYVLLCIAHHDVMAEYAQRACLLERPEIAVLLR